MAITRLTQPGTLAAATPAARVPVADAGRIGKALEGVGAAASSASKEFRDLSLKFAEEEARTEGDIAFNAAYTEAQDDMTNKFLNTELGDAKGVTKKINSRMEEIERKHLAGLSVAATNRARDQFDRVKQQSAFNGAEHEQAQVKLQAQRNRTAGLKLEARNVRANPGNPQIIRESIKNGLLIMDGMKLTEEERPLAESEWISGRWSEAIALTSDASPSAAMRMLEEHREDLTPEDEKKLDDLLKERSDDEAVEDYTATAMAGRDPSKMNITAEERKARAHFSSKRLFPTNHPMNGRSNVRLMSVGGPKPEPDEPVTSTIFDGDQSRASDELVRAIPTMVDGKQLSNDEALAIAKRHGLDKYPTFTTVEEAEAWIEKNHGNITEDGRLRGGNKEAAKKAAEQIRDRITLARQEQSYQQGARGNELALELKELAQKGDFKLAREKLAMHPDDQFKFVWGNTLDELSANNTNKSVNGVNETIAAMSHEEQLEKVRDGSLASVEGLSASDFETWLDRIEKDATKNRKGHESLWEEEKTERRADALGRMGLNPALTLAQHKIGDRRTVAGFDQHLSKQLARFAADPSNEGQLPSTVDLDRMISTAQLSVVYDFDRGFVPFDDDDTVKLFELGRTDETPRSLSKDLHRFVPDEIKDITDVPFEFEDQIRVRLMKEPAWPKGRDGLPREPTAQDIADGFAAAITDARNLKGLR